MNRPECFVPKNNQQLELVRTMYILGRAQQMPHRHFFQHFGYYRVSVTIAYSGRKKKTPGKFFAIIL